jgi:hypothetical protein
MKHIYTSISCLAAAILLASFLLCPVSVTAQSKHNNPKIYDSIEWEGWGDWNGVITGRVIDKFGKPIPNATVKVHSKNLQTKADRNGYFTIKGLQQGGHYSLIFSAKGRETDAARWIPIPCKQSADIGSFSLDVEKIWTNFWVISTNQVSDTVWNTVSNFYQVADSITSIFSYAEWKIQFNPMSIHSQFGSPPTPDTIPADEKPGEGVIVPKTTAPGSSETNTPGTIREKLPVTNGGT